MKMNFSIFAVVLFQFAVISFANKTVTLQEFKKNGIKPDEIKVIGGRDAVDGERPFQVALINSKNSFYCAGALIHSRAVLTAAHCLVGQTVIRIRYNTLKRSTGPTIGVKKIIVHPKYSKGNHANDIGLLILESDFIEGKNAKIIPMTTFKAKAGTTVTLSGWGNTVAGSGAPILPEHLKIADLTEVDRQTCNKHWGAVTENQICASYSSNSACNGDSGGPLTLNGKLYGIVSYGSSPCRIGSPPNVYTRVSSYMSSFINDNLQREKLKFP